MRPDVLIEQTDGNLGRISASSDGITAIVVSGVAISNRVELGQILTLYSTQDAIDLGINEDYDETNKVLAFQHISDFYKGAGEGNKLYVMVVAQTVLLSEIVNKTSNYAALILREKKDVKICVVTRLPQDGYAPVYDEQFDTDIILTISKAQELIDFERAAPRHRYVQMIIEGYDFQGNPSLTKDFRSLESGRVSVVCGNNLNIATKQIDSSTPYAKYAFAAYIAGLRAGLPVQRNIGRVKNGKIAFDSVGLSDGRSVLEIHETHLDVLNKKGLIFAWEHPNKAGFYINNDHVCISITSDYAYSPNGRVADKVSRITRSVYIEELLDDLEVDAQTGRLEVSVVKAFQEKLKKQLDTKMVNKTLKEASNIEVFMDPNQNIISTDQIDVETDVTPKGYASIIKVKQSFINLYKN
ncbi:DUF2586 family protein [Tenacibaculum maritimum]|uniref:DUF2586 family protein n=1 Tax=Tenacibaculum maritimum TaxID=107401 RepID=UPI0038764B5B